MILTDELRSLLDVPRYGMKAPEPTWEQIDAELGKGEQMGYQTVLQFAKVGQMLKAKKGNMPIREFVQRAGQEIPRLTRSSCHNYMTLADNMPLLEQKQPESQRAALALIADAKRPPAPKAMPAPMPTPAPAPSQDDAKWAAADAAHQKSRQMQKDIFLALCELGADVCAKVYPCEEDGEMREGITVEEYAEMVGAPVERIQLALTIYCDFDGMILDEA